MRVHAEFYRGLLFRGTDGSPISSNATGKGPRYRGPAVVFATSLVLFSSAALFAAQGNNQNPAKPAEKVKAEEVKAAAQTPPAAAEFVGSETCQACHEDVSKAFQKNPHHVVETNKKKGWETRACESCHGPGSKHAESTSAQDIINPAKLSVTKSDQNCLKCHLNQSTQMGRVRGGHGKNQVACVGCHSVHKGQENLRPVRFANVNQQCASCHPSVWTEFQRPYKHRLDVNAMSCVDCHNPHGSFLPKMVQTVSGNERSCFRCHGNLRGPFTYEHAPVRMERCSTCHEPHGSANPRMLVRHEVRFLCLECHSNIGTTATPGASTARTGNLGGIPPAFHDLRNPRFQNCTICHIKIHGSHVSPGLTR